MAIKHWNIVKAHADNDRLEKEVADLTAKLAIAEAAAKEIQASNELAANSADKAVADLNSARQTISAMETQIKESAAKIEVLQTELTASKAAQTDFDGKVAKAAAAKAMEISAAQGASPVASQAPLRSGTGDIIAQYNALSPTDKTLFYQKHKTEMDAAYEAQRNK